VQAFVAGADDGVLPQGNPGIHFNDVVQANLGDCAFMAAMIALAREDWQHIYNMITPKANGLFDVKLYKYKDGQGWTTYEVDGSLDRGMDGAALTGDWDTQTGKAEIWPILLEKAFAAMFGGYDNIEARSVLDGWRALTSKAVTEFDTDGKTDSAILEYITNAMDTEGKQVIVDTKSTWPAQLPKDVRESLVPNHSYVVTEYQHDPGTGAITKVHLYNP